MGRLCYPTHSGRTANLDSFTRKLFRSEKEGMAWFLQIQVQVLSKPGVSRYKVDRSYKFIPGYKFSGGHWPRLVARYKLSRSQKTVKVQDFNCVQMRALTAVASAKAGFAQRSLAKLGVRVQVPLQICLECRSKAKSVTTVSAEASA